MSEGRLIRAGHVLTGQDHIVDGAVRIVGDRIGAVGSYRTLKSRFPHDEVTGESHDIITPGFINTHGHFSEGLITGIAKTHTLWEWISALIGPVAPHLDEESAYLGTMIAGIQMLKSGITLANDMFVSDPRPEGPTTPGVVRALEELGLRGIVSFGAGDVRGAAINAILEEHAALAEAASASTLCRFRVGIAAIGAQSESLFERSVDLARHDGVGSHIHLQEIREEVTAIRLQHGVTPIGHSARSGLFSAPAIAAHCVWADADDRSILAEHGVGVAHNPVSNMILASGVCPVQELRQIGVAVGIGVDGPASNDRQDMLEAIKLTSLLQRVDKQQASALTSQEALEMATWGGARALGLESELGLLETGKLADIVVFDGNDPALANVSNPYDSVVFCAGPSQVRDVWVGGIRVVQRGAVTTIDQAEIVCRSRPVAQRIIAESGVA